MASCATWRAAPANPTAEADVEELGGIRHTSAHRDSNDDSTATLIVVSEHGPATLPRNGA
jgi:hypothetical protein